MHNDKLFNYLSMLRLTGFLTIDCAADTQNKSPPPAPMD